MELYRIKVIIQQGGTIVIVVKVADLVVADLVVITQRIMNII